MVANIYCRAYPDEKGIETMNGMIPSSGRRYIAEPIPMKRELKPILSPGDSAVVGRDCRAYPDEKGIETMKCLQELQSCSLHCRAYPDEKGIETPMSPGRGSHVTDGKPDILIRPC